MDIKELNSRARERLGRYCLVCPLCNGRTCAGWVPGIGGVGTGSSFVRNVEAVQAVKLNLRAIHDVDEPDTSVGLFDHRLETPILAAPMAGGADIGNATAPPESFRALVAGAAQAGSLGATSDGPSQDLFETGTQVIAENGGRGIPFLKPRMAGAEVLKRILLAEAAGAWAVGMDIDAAGATGMTKRGHPVGPKTASQLERLIASTSLPFVLKGIMTADEARLAVEIGAAAIVVSNHGGRVLDHTPGTIEVLPAVAAAVQGRIPILADGGIRSGEDVLKFLALGAQAVLVGRPLLIAAVGGGVEGVLAVLRQYTTQLKTAMILTGYPSVGAADRDVLFSVPEAR